MPISIALLFCIPIGFAFYYEARWLTRYYMGRYELTERRGALAFGVFGGLLIPIIYCAGCAEESFSGKIGKMIAVGITVFAGMIIAGFAGRILVSKKKEGNDLGSHD
jgi:hypothetical protein